MFKEVENVGNQITPRQMVGFAVRLQPGRRAFHYGNFVLHISLDDLRELGIATQSVADNVAQPEQEGSSASKKGWVQ
jgi:hypothetical protein